MELWHVLRVFSFRLVQSFQDHCLASADCRPAQAKRPRSGPLLRGRERVVVNLWRKQAHHHVWTKSPPTGPGQGKPIGGCPSQSGRPSCAIMPSHDGRASDVEPGRPAAAAGRPGIRAIWCRVCGPRHHSARRDPACPSAAQGTPFPWGAEQVTGACGRRWSPGTPPGAGTVRVLRLTRTLPTSRSVPQGGSAPGVVVTPGRQAAPRVLASPPGGARLVLADPHIPAPDVSGPRWSRPWGRLLIPDQKARRQRTGRSYTPLELAPAQAAPDRPRPWKPMPRMSAGRHPPAPKAGAVNLRGLTAHRPR